MTDMTQDEFCRHVCENLGVALIAADDQLIVRVWNHAAARMFGAEADQMIGTNMKLVFPHDVRDEALRLVSRAYNKGDIHSLEFEHRDEHGQRRELIATFGPVVCHNGDRIGASAGIRDITHRIALQQQVDESRKMVALGELAGAVAHHFNNLLGGIITSSDYAAATGDPIVMRRVLAQSSQSLMRTSQLINGLTAFAEGDQHADDLSDLSEVVLSVADHLEDKLRDSKIELRVEVPELPVVPVGRMQLRTILRNIARNAVEAMPDGGVLTMTAHSEGRYIALDIIDTGRGMTEEAVSRIFEPFWSTKAALDERPGEAVGLGLSIAHGLAQVIGATIQVSSQEGKGTTFQVRVPLPNA